MMDRTDRHFRYLVRLISTRTFQYTEMVVTGAILKGAGEKALEFNEEEKPLALQVGGDDPVDLGRCARIAEDAGYDEINLNVGCPSGRVRKGSFGACLMNSPEIVAELVGSMRNAAGIPVTVKHRIGVDERDSFDDLARFVETVAGAGCDRFIVHARKAYLQGLSPKENRSVPRLRYEDVYRLKSEFPSVPIEINGGVTDLDQAASHLRKVDGVMIGRAVYDDPYMLAGADEKIFGDAGGTIRSRTEVVREMIPYIESRLVEGVPLGCLTRHMQAMFTGLPGARAWRRHLGEYAQREGAGVEIVTDALRFVT